MMENNERVSIHEAAQLLGVSVPCVRERMRRGIYKIGDAISPKQSGGRNWQFVIYRPKLNQHLGIGEEQ